MAGLRSTRQAMSRLTVKDTSVFPEYQVGMSPAATYHTHDGCHGRPRPIVRSASPSRLDEDNAGDLASILDGVAGTTTECGETYRRVRVNAWKQLSDVDTRDEWGWTALMHAAEQNHKQRHV